MLPNNYFKDLTINYMHGLAKKGSDVPVQRFEFRASTLNKERITYLGN